MLANKTNILQTTIVGLLLILIFILVQPARAQDQVREVSDDEVNAIAKDLFCPVCESTPLDVCPTQACADWREVIRTKLSEGQSEAEITAYFEEQYGERALSEPRTGITIFGWVLPILTIVYIIVLLIGVVIFALYLLLIRKEKSVQPAAEGIPAPQSLEKTKTEPASDDYVARIEQELQEK